MRLHLLGLPHTNTTAAFNTCAFTSNIVRFCRMMDGRGHEIILYGGEHNTAGCTEHVQLMTEGLRASWFGESFDPQKIPLDWDTAKPYWVHHNERAIDGIRERADDRDLLLVTGGLCQKPVADAFPNLQTVEWTVGYDGMFANNCVFPSNAWRHFLYGRKGIDQGRFYDEVIPHFLDPDEFVLGTKGGYLLFVGRVTASKGPHVAVEIAKRAGMPLVICGPGVLEVVRGQGRDKIISRDLTIDEPGVTYGGILNSQSRTQMMAGAVAVLMPTLYLEPFGLVAVEAMLSGTPVVAPDFGAFVETVTPGVTGERFTTLAEAARGVDLVQELNPQAIRDHATAQFGFDAIAPRYDYYFDRLQDLWGEGWAA